MIWPIHELTHTTTSVVLLSYHFLKTLNLGQPMMHSKYAFHFAVVWHSFLSASCQSIKLLQSQVMSLPWRIVFICYTSAQKVFICKTQPQNWWGCWWPNSNFILSHTQSKNHVKLVKNFNFVQNTQENYL